MVSEIQDAVSHSINGSTVSIVRTSRAARTGLGDAAIKPIILCSAVVDRVPSSDEILVACAYMV